MGKFLIFSITLSLIAISGLSAQNDLIGIDSDHAVSSFRMDQWSGQDGLISNNLTSVYQTSDNFIWITSFNGIDRFDGVNFRLFDKSSLPFLSSNAFYRTFEDSKGNIWFCSQSSGVIRYADNEFEQILPEGRNSLSVRSIAEDNEGNLWIGTNNEGLYIYKDDVLQKIEMVEFDLSLIMDIAVGLDGKIYIATNGDGLLSYDQGVIQKLAIDDQNIQNTLNKLFQARDGTLYIGTLDGLYYLNGSEKGMIEEFDGLEVNDIFVDDFDNIWVAAEQGLFTINERKGTFESFTVKDGLPSSQVSSLIFDHENSLWLSTKKSGLIRLRDGYFKNLGMKDGLTSNNVNIITEYDGAYYIGCDDGNISIFKNNQIRQLDLKTKKMDLGIRDIVFDDGGDMLIASYRGLLKINGSSETFFDLNKFGSSNDIRKILKGENGDIWLATRSGGVVKVTASNQVQVFNSFNNSLKTDYILALEKNAVGDVFIGTHSGGLSIIRQNGQIENHPIEQGKSGILIFNIDLMDENIAWITTNIGIYKFENNEFIKVKLDSEIYAETLFDLVIIDEYGWLSSNIGLIRVLLSDLEANVDGALQSVTGRLFDRYDGMASHECTGATRMTLSDEGLLLVPTLGGATILNPHDIKVNDKVPRVYITDFKTDFQHRSITDGNGTIIEPGVVRYEFAFTALSYISPPKVLFKYKLRGIDQDWIQSGSEREVVYTNLPKGNYDFMVQASNNDGIWNEQGATVRFRVKPYFYETTYFYMGVLILAGLLIWGIIVWRVHAVERINSKLRKLNEELDRFVYSASHDLRAPLSSVLGLVEIARLETTIEAKQQCLDMINTSVIKLDGFINDIIDYSRNQRLELQPELLNISEEVHDAFNDLKYLDKEHKIEKIVESDTEKKFATDGRRLNVILKNIISNAIRYHNLKQDHPFIKVKIDYANDKAVISVEDNGIGIDAHHLDSIFKMFYRADESSKGSGLGLYIVKESLDKIGGQIEVKSILHRGSSFIITIPQLKLPVE